MAAGAAGNVARRFGENLRRARTRAAMSQESLGLAAGLHRTEIGLLERGERVPRIDTAVKLAGSLSIPPGELLDGIDWRAGSMKPGGFDVTDGEGE